MKTLGLNGLLPMQKVIKNSPVTVAICKHIKSASPVCSIHEIFFICFSLTQFVTFPRVDGLWTAGGLCIPVRSAEVGCQECGLVD
jgi:hypothetical protein